MNYELLYTQLLKEHGELQREHSDNNEYYAFQMMQLNDQVMNKTAEVALLKQELKRKVQ